VNDRIDIFHTHEHEVVPSHIAMLAVEI